jgi:hypothetical protein
MILGFLHFSDRNAENVFVVRAVKCSEEPRHRKSSITKAMGFGVLKVWLCSFDFLTFSVGKKLRLLNCGAAEGQRGSWLHRWLSQISLSSSSQGRRRAGALSSLASYPSIF